MLLTSHFDQEAKMRVLFVLVVLPLTLVPAAAPLRRSRRRWTGTGRA